MKPALDFTLPIRLFNDEEDKKFLKDNFLKRIKGISRGSAPQHPSLPVKQPLNGFGVKLITHGYDYVKLKTNRKEIEKIFKDVYPFSRLITFEDRYQPKETPGGLPYVQIQVFYL